MGEYIYKKKFINSSVYVIIQCYDSGYEREVPETRPDYQSWLLSGYILKEIPPPEPIDLEIYKQNKIVKIKNESARRCAELTVYRDSEVAEKLTQDIRESLLARYAEITMLSTQQPLTIDEQNEIIYLKSIWDSIRNIQNTELSLVKQIQKATTHAEVDLISWTEDIVGNESNDLNGFTLSI